MQKFRIGELLIEKGLIDQHQIDDAIQLQQQSGNKLGKVLVDANMIAEKNIKKEKDHQDDDKSIKKAKAEAAKAQCHKSFQTIMKEKKVAMKKDMKKKAKGN